MTHLITTPEQVVMQFLPDFKARLKQYAAMNLKHPVVTNFDISVTFRDFCIEHFPEALSELLKAQREECARAATTKEVETGIGVFEEIDRASILNAPVPIPENDTKNCEWL